VDSKVIIISCKNLLRNCLNQTFSQAPTEFQMNHLLVVWLAILLSIYMNN
jgi:hypothetical protein